MLRKLPRVILNVLTALSLLLCVGVCVLWLRARRTATPDYVTARLPAAGDLAARFDPGGVTLIGSPPAPPGAAGEAAVRRLTAVMHNGDLAFGCQSRPDDDLALMNASYGVTTRDGRPLDPNDFTPNTANATSSLEQMLGGGQPAVTLDAYRRPLLEALDDPNRVAAAHHLLRKIGWRFTGRAGPIMMYGPLSREGAVYVLDQDGLRVEIPPPDEHTERRPANGVAGTIWTYYLDKPSLARVDPAQASAIRGRWFLVLGRPLATIPYWLLSATAAVPAAAWVVGRVRRRVRHHSGLCARCGYDLRATPGRCPECGTVARAR